MSATARLLCAALALLAATSARSDCECLWRGSFADVAPGTDLVISATVIASKGNSIDLEPDRILRGNPPPTIPRVWLKTGDYCRPEASAFPVGSQWVMALYRIEEQVEGGFNPATPNVSYGRVGDYRLSSCGGYWLKLQEGRVTGNLVKAPRWEREPNMSPVLIDLVSDYMAGRISAEALLAASRENPALKELMLDTREFLRNED